MGTGIPVGHYLTELDRDGTILAANGPADCPVNDLIGTNIQRWVVPAARQELERALKQAFATGESRSFACVGADDGRSYELRVLPLQRDGGTVGAVLLTEEITERDREQQALRESEQRFHALVHGAFEGLAITVDGTIMVANEALGRMLRVPAESLLGRNGYEFCAPESRAVAREAVRTGDETPYEVIGIRPDGTRFPCENLGRNIVFLGKTARLTGFRDLTERHRLERERKEIEEQMRHAQKLESLGTLAGGIAHDFNNVLMAVLANAEMALGLPETSGEPAARLADIRLAAMRGRELTRQLLNYATPGPLANQPVDLSEMVRDTVALIGVTISKKAELSLHLEAAVAEGDQGQLRQLVMNLVINASEALADRPGRIEIHVAPVDVTPGEVPGSPLLAEIPSGRAVILSVRDTGEGISEEAQERIFEPFFTTKLAGRGLGLASVLNVVRGHRGAIRVRSTPGNGTEFTVWLRRSDEPASLRTASADQPLTQLARGLVLVADDEPMLRDAARGALRSLGFEVILAEDGESAVARFDEHGERLALVLLDLTMPKLSGVDVLRRIRERNTTLPVLCVSGHNAELVVSALGSDPATRFLAKPYTSAELAAAIDALL